MRFARDSAVVKYSAVVGLTACALVISLLLQGIFEPNFEIPLIAAVLVSAWFFGLWGGIVCSLLATLSIPFVLMFLPPLFKKAGIWVSAGRLGTFLLFALLIAKLVDALRASDRKSAAILSSIGDGVIVTNQQGLVTFLNPVAEALTGWTSAAAHRHKLSEVLRLKYEHSDKIMEFPIERVLREKTMVHSNPQTLLVSQNGTERMVEESAAPIRQESGKVSGAILVLRDTTARRHAENQISRSQKMDAVGRMAGGVAGDFNNLLTVISGWSDMLYMEINPGNPTRRFVEEIMSAAERAAGLTRQLMALSRGHVAEPRLLDLNALINNMQTMLQRLMGDKIQVVLLPEPALGKVKADPTQIEQMIVNLAMNSREAMPNGGRFVLETTNCEIDQQGAARTGWEPGTYVMLAVSDNGTGMDSATRERLFEPFFTTKDRGKGSGLGLAIVYGMVRQSQGHINVFSQPGSGTIFEIYLPRVRETASESVHRVRKGQRGSDETILVVDDEEGIRKLVHAILATHGYQVLEAKNGVEGLDTYRAHRDKIAMVLTDVVMPQMDGFEMGDHLLRLQPDLKLLYMSGYRENLIGTAEVELKRPVLHKPFTPDALLARVRQMLDVQREARGA